MARAALPLPPPSDDMKAQNWTEWFRRLIPAINSHFSTKTINANYTVQSTDGVIFVGASAPALTITLGPAYINGNNQNSSSQSANYRVYNRSANTTTVAAPTGATINGAAFITIAAGSAKIIDSDGVSVYATIP